MRNVETKTENDSLERYIELYKQCSNRKKKQVLYLKIVEKSIVTVKKLVNVIAFQTGVSKEDLLQIGTVGLLKAIDGYSSDKNASFLTYSTYIVKGEIWHYLRDKNQMIRPPRGLQELLSKVTSTIKLLQDNGCAEPTIYELSDVLKIEPEKLKEVLDIAKYQKIISLEEYVFNDNEYTPVESLVFDKEKDYAAIYEDKMLVVNAIEKLPEILQKVVKLTYYEDKTQKEIAQELGISSMCVSRYLKKALNMLHKIISEGKKD